LTYSFVILWALLFCPGAPGAGTAVCVSSKPSEVQPLSLSELPSPDTVMAPNQPLVPAQIRFDEFDRNRPSSSRPDAPLPDLPSPDNNLVPTPVTHVPEKSSTDFQWEPASAQSFMFTVIMHAYRFSTEKGTRDAVRGPWFENWMRSIGEFRGWDDGDGFVTSYVAHPMEGSVFGFIQQQNDPRYRAVQFGDGRAYWISKLHSLAFAAIWSTQWTAGPISENSLGNTNLYASPGFVDLTGTPTLGMGWMIGEDIVDRYPISWLETKTSNPYLLSVVRGLGNPTRSFANMMSMRVPWHRDSRPGLWRLDRIRREEMIASGEPDASLGFSNGFMQQTKKQQPDEEPGTYPLEAPIELMATSMYERLGSQNCYGGGGTGAARVNSQLQILAELSGCLITGFRKYESGDSLSYMVGPRWAPRVSHRVSPYAQFLLGGRRVTHEILDPGLRELLLGQWNAGDLPHYPRRSQYLVEDQANGVSMAAGGGFDVRLNHGLALRVADLEYTHSWLPVVDQIHASDGVRISAGLVLRIGTW
jgi:hypothetical protein